MNNPRNSYHEKEIEYENDGHTYREAFAKRAKADGVDVDDPEAVAKYLTEIKDRALTIANVGSVTGSILFDADLDASTEELLVLKDTDALGFIFYMNFLNATGRSIQYNSENFLRKTKDGQEIYQACVQWAMEICENGVSPNNKIMFKQIDGAAKVDNNLYLTEQYLQAPLTDTIIHPIANINQWLSLNQTFSALAGECTYDGDYYNLELTYYLQDYYDWYYPDELDGKSRIFGASCDKMCWLHLYGMAKNFEDLGIYRVNIRWKKGDKYNAAKQNPHTFYSYRPD